MIPPLSIGRGKEEVLPGIEIDLVPANIFFTVLGEPVSKGRPRARIVRPRSGKEFLTFYSPAETVAYEEEIAWAAKGKMGGKAPLNCPCEVVLRAYFKLPASWSTKRKKAALHGAVSHVTKPDLDNIIKLLDSLNGIVFVDDNRVCRITAQKGYSLNPRLEIEIKEIVPTILLTESKEEL